MITLEDQIRRYAVDVAGPALGDPPDDLVAVSRRHRGRWLLVAALVVFVAGISWLAVRPGEHTQSPSVDTVPVPVDTVPVPVVTSWAGPPGPCTAEVAGIVLEGPDGVGLCVAATAQTDGTISIGQFADGVGMGAFQITDCDLIDADRSMSGAGSPVVGGSVWFWITPPQVATLVVHLPDGEAIAASTLEVPGATGIRVAALRLSASTENPGPFDWYDAGGQPYQPTDGAPISWPDWCPEAQIQR